MNHTDKENIDRLIEFASERGKIGEFMRQFLDPKNKSKLRDGLKIEEVFEKAGYKPMGLLELPGEIRVSARNLFEEEEDQSNCFIFGKPEKETNQYYLIRKIEGDYDVSRFSKANNKKEVIGGRQNFKSTLADVIGTVAYHTFAEEQEQEMQAIHGAREKAKGTLRP